MMLHEGDLFPEFSLPDQDGNVLTLSSLAGSKAVIYFYPKDDTSGCTLEACEFRDLIPRFEGVKIIGVSPDSEKSHRKFVEKFGLNFTLLSDTDKQLCEACGVWVEKSMYGKKYMGVVRTTFLLSEEGSVLQVWSAVKAQGHAAEVLSSLK